MTFLLQTLDGSCSPILIAAASESGVSALEAFTHALEQPIGYVVAVVEVVLEMIALGCVLVGLFQTARLVIALRRRHTRQFLLPFLQVRLRFGIWLALALEFQLGADIVATTVAPTLVTLGKLGAVALIRTFLNYFLNKEMAEVLHFQQEREKEECDEG